MQDRFKFRFWNNQTKLMYAFTNGCYFVEGCFDTDLSPLPIKEALMCFKICEVLGNIYENPELLEGE